ncbi:MAG: nuclear transport factor 2 family protein [Acidobacteriota bacterium]
MNRGPLGLCLPALLLMVSAMTASAQKLPPQKPQPTPEKVVEEHFAALNACDWTRLMAQYADDMTFFSKDGGMVQGREAIGAMFRKAVEPPSRGGQCGMKMTPLHIKVVGNTVNVVWRAEAPFFTRPYLGSEAFETRNGLLAAQVTTWDPSALPMKK